MAVKIVKSVARVLEILELFQRERRAMPAVEIAEKLHYPLASTHEILKTCVEYGYFSYGTPRWAYKPTSRFPVAVEWLRDAVADDQQLARFMEALNTETRETINLSRRIATKIKIVRGFECLHQIGVSSKPGTSMELTQSLTGITMLSHFNEQELNRFFTELEQVDPEQHKITDFDLVDDILAEINQYGAAMRTGINVEEIGAICIPVLSEGSDDRLVVGVVGPSERIQKNAPAHIKTIKRVAREHKIKTRRKIILK